MNQLTRRSVLGISVAAVASALLPKLASATPVKVKWADPLIDVIVLSPGEVLMNQTFHRDTLVVMGAGSTLYRCRFMARACVRPHPANKWGEGTLVHSCIFHGRPLDPQRAILVYQQGRLQ